MTSRLTHTIIPIAAAAGLLLAQSPAWAECTGQSVSWGSSYYDGKDPAATGCNVNASKIATRPVKNRYTGQQVATVEVYYSWSCQSNWIRVSNNPYGGETVKNIFSDLGGGNSEVDCGYASSYSMMVYAPGNTGIDVQVYLKAPDAGDWGWIGEAEFSL